MDLQEEQICPSVETEESIDLPPAETTEVSEIELLKKKAQKTKIIALDQLNKPIFSNPSNFSTREKNRLMKAMEEWFNKPDEEVNELFNEIVLDKLETEFEKIPINPMNITYAPDPEFHKDLPPIPTQTVIDIAGNEVQIPAI